MAPDKKNLFCFGLGYSAQFLTCHLSSQGWTTGGTNRRGDGDIITKFSRSFPLPNFEKQLREATHVLFSIPPDAGGDPVIACHGADIANLPNLEWLGYLSTTGVYGNHNGDWVDETTPTLVDCSLSMRSQRRLIAENSWLNWALPLGMPMHIFRLAGIYGPGRNMLQSLHQGRARRIVKAKQVFSRIHVYDLISTLEASMANISPGAIYNVCDDEPAPPQDVVTFAAELLGQAPPPAIAFEEADLSPMVASFYRDNKRVSNKRIRDELKVKLNFPNYRVGLQNLLKEDVLNLMGGNRSRH